MYRLITMIPHYDSSLSPVTANQTTPHIDQGLQALHLIMIRLLHEVALLISDLSLPLDQPNGLRVLRHCFQVVEGDAPARICYGLGATQKGPLCSRFLDEIRRRR